MSINPLSDEAQAAALMIANAVLPDCEVAFGDNYCITLQTLIGDEMKYLTVGMEFHNPVTGLLDGAMKRVRWQVDYLRRTDARTRMDARKVTA